MALADTIRSVEENVGSYYETLGNHGYTVPSQKNLANLAGSVPSVSNFNPEDYKAGFGALIIRSQTDTNYNQISGVYPILTQAHWNQVLNLYDSGSETFAGITTPFGYTLVVKTADVAGYILGDNCTNLPNDAFHFSSNMNALFRTEVVETIGDYVLANTGITLTPLRFERLESIGQNFCSNAYNLNTTVYLPPSVEQVGEGFMEGCNHFIGPLIVDTAHPPTDNRSLSTATNTMAIYKTGVTVQGTEASTWKNALPNRTSYPLRRLN